MTKVYPNLTAVSSPTIVGCSSNNGSFGEDSTVLTVWKKSLLFNCTGFTVFDCKGNLKFRVDNYLAGNKTEIVLMDAAGKPLLTIRRKRLSLGENWVIYDGESKTNPKFCVRKQANILNTKCLAYVSSSCNVDDKNGRRSANKNGRRSANKNGVMYEIEGSYAQRSCVVYDQKRMRVAEIKRKEAVIGGVALGGDVFKLIVEPQFDTALAMALVILLDQMFGSSSSRRYL